MSQTQSLHAREPHPEQRLHNPAGRRPDMRRPFARTMREKLEAALTAAAFAEESQVEAAREILAQATRFDPRGASSPR